MALETSTDAAAMEVIEQEEAILATEALRRNNLQELFVSLDAFQEDEATIEELWVALRSNTSLTTLSFFPPFVSLVTHLRFPAGLSEALRHNNSLQELNLSEDDRFGSEGAVALAEGVRSNSSLRKLNLQDSEVGPEGAEALGKALRNNPSLKMLQHLFDRSIGLCCTAMLGDALRSRSALQNLVLAGNGLGDRGAAALGEALRFNTSLEVLNLAANSVGEEGAVALGQGLRHNTSLQHLDLSCNDIDGDGLVALVEALCMNTSLLKLDLCFNRVCSKAALRALGQADHRVVRVRS